MAGSASADDDVRDVQDVDGILIRHVHKTESIKVRYAWVKREELDDGLVAGACSERSNRLLVLIRTSATL